MNKKDFRIIVDGTSVPVSEEVYKAYYQEENHVKYLEKKDKQNKVTSYSFFDGEGLSGEEVIPDLSAALEDTVIEKIINENLHKVIAQLEESERELIDLLFFQEQSERELAQLYGVSQPAVHKRKNKILKKLKNLLKN
ncbi:sigma-70 family RNA polymerase sigma factor [Lachnospiraceae bacterium OttesenSCG-928-D06]|nr:sigma-70 family RNA polymerase sigma factor [Lachnospiraceae bacterium OttesenSCG-928-D06]